MFSGSIFSSDDSFNDNYFNNSRIFVPNVEHKLKIYFEKKCNNYINNPFDEELEKEEFNQKKEEDILIANNNSKVGNIIGPYFNKLKVGIIKDINASSINLDESKEETPNVLNNSLSQSISCVDIPIESSSFECNNKTNNKKIFLTIYPKRVTIFKKAENKLGFIKINSEDELINKKRRRNKEDDIRRMIGRRFFNDVLLNLINAILKKVGSINLFEKFQQDVIYYLVKKYNKKVLNMTLEDIFVTKELYNKNNLEKYNHNLRLINQIKSDEFIDIRESTQIDRILKMKYYDLFNEYLASNEFIEEINRLKNNNKKFDNFYVEKYIYYSNHFIDNFLD